MNETFSPSDIELAMLMQMRIKEIFAQNPTLRVIAYCLNHDKPLGEYREIAPESEALQMSSAGAVAKIHSEMHPECETEIIIIMGNRSTAPMFVQ